MMSTRSVIQSIKRWRRTPLQCRPEASLRLYRARWGNVERSSRDNHGPIRAARRSSGRHQPKKPEIAPPATDLTACCQVQALESPDVQFETASSSGGAANAAKISVQCLQ